MKYKAWVSSLPWTDGKMSDIPVSIYCPYCHRHTSLHHTTNRVEIASGTYSIPADWQQGENAVWWIGMCNNCRRPVLVLNDGSQVYPNPMPSPTDERIPNPMRSDLMEAKMCFSAKAFRGCAVMARRAIEASCIQKGASKNRELYQQIDELKENGVITEDLRKWGHSVRWIANDAAHPDSAEVTEEDAKDILHLAEQFLHVIYVTPEIAEEQIKKRGKKKE